MDKNVGGIDRTARLVLGLILAIAGLIILLGYWALGTLIGVLALLIGVILLGTGATQKCVLNNAAGIDTTE